MGYLFGGTFDYADQGQQKEFVDIILIDKGHVPPSFVAYKKMEGGTDDIKVVAFHEYGLTWAPVEGTTRIFFLSTSVPSGFDLMPEDTLKDFRRLFLWTK